MKELSRKLASERNVNYVLQILTSIPSSYSLVLSLPLHHNIQNEEFSTIIERIPEKLQLSTSSINKYLKINE